MVYLTRHVFNSFRIVYRIQACLGADLVYIKAKFTLKSQTGSSESVTVFGLNLTVVVAGPQSRRAPARRRVTRGPAFRRQRPGGTARSPAR